MRLFDAMRPAMDWAEAAMLPAGIRTLSGGAALRQVPGLQGVETADVQETGKAAASGVLPEENRTLRQAAFRHVMEKAQRANSWVTYTYPWSS